MMNKTRCCLPLLLSLLALPLPAAACLLCTCTATATGVSFGDYNPFSFSDLPAAGNIHLFCSGVAGPVNYTIRLNKGVYSTSFPPRQMGLGANRLNYNLYTDVNHGSIWGDGSGGTVVISGSSNFLLGSVDLDFPVYGLIPASQTSTAVGIYSDLITVTVTYN